MKKYSKYAALVLAAAYLIGCSGGGSCSSSNNSGGNNGDASTLQIIAPKIIYSKTTAISSGYVTVINPTATAVKNLHYSLSKQVGGGSVTTIDQTSADNCSVISAYGQCNFKLNVAAGAVAGSLAITANNDSSTLAKLFKSSQSASTATFPVGIEQAYYNSIAGADGITVSYYHTVIAGVPYIFVSGIVASTNAGNFNNIALVDNNGNVIPNQQLISGTAGSAQGSTFSILLPVPASSGSSQTIKVQTQRVATDGSITVVSTATTANTLTTTSGVGITDMLPGAVYLTAANPEQTITFANNGDVVAQLQSFAASNPNIEVVFSPTNLASGGIAYATLKLKTSASAASSGSATLSYNNGRGQVTTAAVVEQNVSPQPNPNPGPSPSPTSTPTPPAPTAGLTAALTPDNNFFTTTAIGTVSRQLTLTNTGNTAENGFVLTLPTNFTISDGTSNSCTITQGTSPATISNSLAANGNCTVSVVYTNSNTVDPAQSADISIAYNYNGSTAATPATAAVNYKVTQSTANLTLTPNPLAFANVLNNGADSNSQTVTVTNSGDETATSLAFNISGTNSTLFSTIAGGSCTSGGGLSSTNGSNSCTINTQFGTAISSVGAGSKTANLNVSYTPYTNGSTRTASTVLNGQVVAAQGANIAQGTATASGFAGGTGADVANAYQIQQNATPLPTISYTITNSGNVPASNFYLSGTAAGWTMDDGCGTSSNKATLAASGGNCTVKFTLNSTATSGAQNLDVSGITMNWVDQDTPGGQTQNMRGTQYVNVYAPAVISVTPTNWNIAQGDQSIFTATLSGGYNVSDQTIALDDANSISDGLTITSNPSPCVLNLITTSCTFTVAASDTATVQTNTLRVTNSGNLTTTPESVRIVVGKVTSVPEDGATGVSISLNQFGLNFSFDMNVAGVNNNSIALNAESSAVNLLASCASITPRKYICTSSVGLVPNKMYILRGVSLPISGGGTMSFSSKFTTQMDAIKFAYIASFDDGVWRCTINGDASLSSCDNLQDQITQAEAVFIFNGKAYISSGNTNTIYLCSITADNGDLNGCVATGSGFYKPRGLVVFGNNAYIANGETTSISKCNVDLNGQLSNCVDSGASGIQDPQDITINGKYLLVASAGNSRITTCSINGTTGLLDNCFANSGITSHNYQDVMIYNGHGYVVSGGSYLASCSYSDVTGNLSNCNQANGVASGDYEGLAIYNSYIYISGTNGIISWCSLNIDGSINGSSCASLSGIAGARGMSIN